LIVGGLAYILGESFIIWSFAGFLGQFVVFYLYNSYLQYKAAKTIKEQAERVGQEVEALYVNGPAAGGGVTQSVREVGAVASALVPRQAVQPRVQVLELGAGPGAGLGA
jgi:hypothetical protein